MYKTTLPDMRTPWSWWSWSDQHYFRLDGDSFRGGCVGPYLFCPDNSPRKSLTPVALVQSKMKLHVWTCWQYIINVVISWSLHKPTLSTVAQFLIFFIFYRHLECSLPSFCWNLCHGEKPSGLDVITLVYIFYVDFVTSRMKLALNWIIAEWKRYKASFRRDSICGDSTWIREIRIHINASESQCLIPVITGNW